MKKTLSTAGENVSCCYDYGSQYGASSKNETKQTKTKTKMWMPIFTSGLIVQSQLYTLCTWRYQLMLWYMHKDYAAVNHPPCHYSAVQGCRRAPVWTYQVTQLSITHHLTILQGCRRGPVWINRVDLCSSQHWFWEQIYEKWNCYIHILYLRIVNKRFGCLLLESEQCCVMIVFSSSARR